MSRHRQLNVFEKKQFRKFAETNIKNNYILQLSIHYPFYQIFLPIIYTILLGIIIFTYKTFASVVIGIILGFITLQISFIFNHMWAHGLMLEYDAWTIGDRRTKNLSSVIFYAFYHHHHTKKDNWMPELSYYNKDGAWNVATSHWESFSMLTSKTMILLFILTGLIPHIITPFLLGYELGVFFLPMAHDWVHLKTSSNYYLQYIFYLLELLGLFASHKDHLQHHIYDHATVYQSFSSSGIYISSFDKYINKIWDSAYNSENTVKILMIYYEYISVLTTFVSLTIIYMIS